MQSRHKQWFWRFGKQNRFVNRFYIFPYKVIYNCDESKPFVEIKSINATMKTFLQP